MIITRQIQKYLVFREESVLNALRKIEQNNARVVFVVADNFELCGVVSDGDVRRWLVSRNDVDLSVRVDSMMQRSVRSVPWGVDNRRISMLFRRGVECVPLVDIKGRVNSLAFEKNIDLEIGSHRISEHSPALVIAEIGNNHQGDIQTAKLLVDKAVQAGADCVKFQMRNTDALYVNRGDKKDVSADLGSQYTLDLLAKFQLSDSSLIEVFDYCKEKGLVPLCTPWDKDSLDKLERYGIPAYKVASADFTNHEFLAAIAATGKPMICSTGMSQEQEIFDTVKFLQGIAANFVLLHCNSTYPTPWKDVNLRYMLRLKDIAGGMVGYSGHERGIEVAIAAVALGAVVIEKHITLNKEWEGTDHKASLLPAEFASMVESIRHVEAAMGSRNVSRELTQGELINRESLAKSLVASTAIQEGEIITRDRVDIKSPGKGLQPNRIGELVGKRSNRNITAGDFFYPTDINGRENRRLTFRFGRPFGIPVRYHDFADLSRKVDMDFVEFHFSYRDLEQDIEEHIGDEQALGLAVHSPELFECDHIIDLCADDAAYRDLSISHIQRVVDITNKLKKYFPASAKPVLVLNAGGWNTEGFYSVEKTEEKYLLLAQSLEGIDFSGVQLAIQTMPPFPWHFGGQSYHNLFVSPEKIIQFCERLSWVSICLDISHTQMACSYYGWRLDEFIKKLGPKVVHLHISDAQGIDGEGVEVGMGDVDFRALAESLNQHCEGVGFIPEVWQGHKNSGEGFWKALELLESVKL